MAIHPSPATQAQRTLTWASRHGIFRPRDLAAQGIQPATLARLTAKGALERVGRGLYRLPTAAISEHHTLAQVAKRMPQGVICLLSALRFHRLTTQSPAEVWVALGRKARRPADADLPVRVVRFSEAALTQGVHTYTLEGVPALITTPAKTVADCFKYRHKLGLEVALEALREGRRERRFTLDELWAMARVDRVANVLRPYLETLA